jgi:alpha-L-fucosidase
VFPNIEAKIVKAELLSGGEVKVVQTEKEIAVIVPPKYQQELVTVIRLDLDRPAITIQPRQGPDIPTPKAQASNVFQNNPTFGADKAVDRDETTRWATDYGIHSAWLEVDLGKPMKVGGVRILEAVEFGERIRKFVVKCKVNDEWKTVLSGNRVGAEFVRKFPPVTAQVWRLEILEATEGPTIYEFQLLPAED